MSLRWRALVFTAGAVAFALLVAHARPRHIAESVAAVGWLLVPIVLLYGLVNLCNAAAWHVVMAGEPVRPPFLRTYAITISAFALNFITPFVQAGGEPYRMAAAAHWIGTRRSAGCAVLYTMLHALSSLLLWFSALGLALIVLPHRPALVGGILALMLGVGSLAAVVLAGHRGGVLERGLRVLQALPLVRRLAPRLESSRAVLAEVDRQIMDFYHRAPRRFLAALALDFLGRCLAVGEFYLICHGMGIAISLAQAYLIGGLLALAINASFFVPFELGSKEAALFFIYHLVGLTPELGVAASVITRVRELTWIGIGVGLVWAGGGRRVREPETSAEP